MTVDISVIIVNWNTCQLLVQCLSSIAQSNEDLNLEVIVVDNASTDGSVEHIEENFPDIRLIRNIGNQGFAAANNLGIAIAKGRLILLLNSDTIVHKGALKTMTTFLDSSPLVGLCSCRILNSDGSIQPNVRHFPSFGAMFHRYTVLKHFGLLKRTRKYYKMKNFSYDKSAEVDQLTGSVLMIKKDVLKKVGNMDENFFFYFEETDLCRRIQQAGFKNCFIPYGEVTHIGQASSNMLASHKTKAMFFKSLFCYFRKHNGKTKTFFFSVTFKPLVLFHVIIEIITAPFLALLFWCLRKDIIRINHKLKLSKDSLMFLIKYNLRFLFY